MKIEAAQDTQFNIVNTGKNSPDGLKKAAAEFESLFLNYMLKTMRDTVMKGDLFHGGSGEDIYTSLLDAELSRIMSSNGGIGLQNILLDQLSGRIGETDDAGAPGAGLNDIVENDGTGTEKRLRAEDAVEAEKKDDQFKFPLQKDKTAYLRISSGFGPREDPLTGEERFHHGIDIAAKEGSPVYPAADGTVVFSGAKGGYGNVVEVLHDNGLVTRYGHNSKNAVKAGDSVRRTDAIAYVGSTGRSTGPHLHFEVLKDGRGIDPGTLFTAKG